MKFGVLFRAQFLPDEDARRCFEDLCMMVRQADALGFDSITKGSHYGYADLLDFQQIPMLARLATEAPNCRLNTGIVLLSLHKPVDIAEQLATLDVITNGKLIFGCGLGYRDVEFAAFGTSQGERVQRLEENLALVKRLWAEDEVSYEGSHFSLDGVTLGVKPLQKPHPPIWMGANADAAIKRAARIADCWYMPPHNRITSLLRQLDVYKRELERVGKPLPDETLAVCQSADAILFGAIGGPEYDNLERELRPEKGLLNLRSALALFSNLRPAILYPQLADASSLKAELVAGLDIMIVRELTGGIYFGQPRGIRELDNGEREGYNTLVYAEHEIERIARSAFDIAMLRNRKLCSVDKANVLEVSELWREVLNRISSEYPNVELSHMYVDNASMQLVRAPKQFDVIVTTNLFGDILSDTAAMLTGSIGMLPSASLDQNVKGMYEPVHGSAPDIAGKGIANPLATILSLAMMLRYSLQQEGLAEQIETAVGQVLNQGFRTADIADGTHHVSTAEMGDAVVAALRASAQ